jgi:hypothetical protein
LLKIKQIGQFNSLSSQLLLATRLNKLICYKTIEMPITPLLINLALEKIKRKITETSSIENLLKEIPSTIPGLYIEYIYSVNKPFNGFSLTNDQLLSICQSLAVFCLDQSFLPQTISKRLVRKKLEEDYPALDPDTVLSLLHANDLIQLFLFDNPLSVVSVILDPLAENLAAFSFAQRMGNIPAAWEQFYQRLSLLPDQPTGFIQAIVLIHSQFWKIEGWTDPNDVEQFKTMEDILFNASVNQ